MQAKTIYPGLTPLAYEIAKKEDDKRKAKGYASSVRSVVSEAVITTFGAEKK